ncbi:MAG: hypothetical protein WA549_09055 [Thermoplasmata archaeon]
MVPLPIVQIVAGLVALFLLALPLGSLLLEAAERWIGRRLDFSVTERVLLSFYATGGFLFILASIPLPLFTVGTVVGLLLVGVAVRTALLIRNRGRDLLPLLRFVQTPVALVLLALAAGLLVLEVISVASLALGNSVDGSVYALFVHLIVRNHTLPWTLQPYAATGVVYPQGAPVWMTLPALAFGWPIVSLPIVVPPLFLALTVPAAFCLGERLGGYPQPRSAWVGLLFAGFFGLVLSWPRLYVGGSFDFLFSLPLFLILLGWLVPLSNGPIRSKREILVFGLLLGATAALSASTGTTILLLLVVFLLFFSGNLIGSLRRWGGALLAWLGVMAAFLVRSLVGLVVWFDYPGHVWAAVGSPPYASYGFPQPLSSSIVLGELDPFVLWKPKLSPFPTLSLTIAILLGAGLVLLILNTVTNSSRLRPYLSRQLTRTILVASVAIFVEESVLLLISGWNATAAGPQSVTNFDEISILLFTCFELAALVPLLYVLNYLTQGAPDSAAPATARPAPPPVEVPRPARRRRIGTALLPENSVAVAFAVALLVVPLALGLGYTVSEVPSYIHDHIEALANVTAGDLAVLEWAGAHLPACSRVLVAPGSVAQYLPEYAEVQMVFPVFPPTVNLSYYAAVDNLIQGVYLNSTRSDLLSIGVTTIFVAGRSSAAYPPFQLAPLLSSSDFTLLVEQQDAAIWAFQPGIVASGCPP